MQLSDYLTKLAYIREHLPDSPHLERLGKGNTVTNRILIDKVYDSIELIPEQKQIDPQTDDNIVRMYDTKLKKAFMQRARLSNSFHISTGDDEDLKISDDIEVIQKEIAKLMKEKAHYIEKKELPEQLDQEQEYEIPTDPFALINKLNSVRTSLVRTEKDLSQISHKDEPTRYEKKQVTIQRLAYHKRLLEQAIEKQKTV